MRFIIANGSDSRFLSGYLRVALAIVLSVCAATLAWLGLAAVLVRMEPEQSRWAWSVLLVTALAGGTALAAASTCFAVTRALAFSVLVGLALAPTVWFVIIQLWERESDCDAILHRLLDIGCTT